MHMHTGTHMHTYHFLKASRPCTCVADASPASVLGTGTYCVQTSRTAIRSTATRGWTATCRTSCTGMMSG